MSEEVDKFCKVFRCEVGPGKRYYKRLPVAFAANYMNDIDKLTTHEEVGVRIEMSSSDFEKLMCAASDGLLHQQFRERNPVAQEAYEHYMTLYFLTRQQR